MKISTIFFDLGRVLVYFDWMLACNQIAEKAELDAETVRERFLTDPLFAEYELGHISTGSFCTHLKEKLLFEGTIEELEFACCNIFSPLDEHIQMAYKLAEFYPMAIISNTCEAHIRFLEARYDFFSIFREKIYSFQVGCMKPDPHIYELALQRMNANRYESLFIDDLEENVLTPSRMGWQTIHLRPDVSLRLALQSYDLVGISALDI